MTYYPTLDEDLARAKEILERGKNDDTALQGLGITPETLPTLVGGTIYGGDVYAAYKLLESFVAHITTHFRPDHNGECLNCDEPEDGHGLAKQIEQAEMEIGRLREVDEQSRDHLAALMRRNVQLLAEQMQFYGLFSDYEAPCTSYLQAQAIWNDRKRREAIERAEIRRLRALVDAVGEDICKLALWQQQRVQAEIAISKYGERPDPAPVATVACPLCDWTARNEVEDDGHGETVARIERHLQAAFADHVARAHGGQSLDK